MYQSRSVDEPRSHRVNHTARDHASPSADGKAGAESLQISQLQYSKSVDGLSASDEQYPVFVLDPAGHPTLSQLQVPPQLSRSMNHVDQGSDSNLQEYSGNINDLHTGKVTATASTTAGIGSSG